MPITGTAHKFGDHVDTDVIIPARHLGTTDPAELASHCMEDIDAEFIQRVQPGDVMVAGRNFGCGSSREHAPIAIKAAGVSVVIAGTFARIFYRNALNIGLPIIESEEAACGISAGDQVEVDLEGGAVKNLTTGAEFTFAPLVGAAQDLIKAGGLVELTKQKLAARG
ncbi:MAG: 3-isopropylmalate dehydratase small subunit [Armatimonadetes bacterium]|nr:3-isopropylmalate dehydratase small subunit [Armatimonadota bacterium]